MSAMIQAQRATIRYYQKLLEKERNIITRFLIKKEIRKSEKDLVKLMSPKKFEL